MGIDTFCKFTDNILSTIEFLDDPRLIPAKELLNDIKTRNILKLVVLLYLIKT